MRERHARWLADRPASVPPPSVPLWFRLEALTPLQRVCVELHYVWGFTLPEIASRLGLSEGQVKGHLQRARQHLREVEGEIST